MKKLWTQPKYKRHMARVRRCAERRRSDHRGRQRSREQDHKQSRTPRDRRKTRLTAPSAFSLIVAPDVTIKFLEDIRTKIAMRSLFIDLRKVERIDPEAVAAFVAIIKSGDSEIRGNQPRNAKCRRRLHEFGFFEHVAGVPTVGDNSGKIRMEKVGTHVKSEVVQNIVGFGMKELCRVPKHGPSYRVFCEAIANTFQHADKRKEGVNQWCASTYFDRDNAVACFTAIDLGVGIVESFSVRQKAAEIKEVGWSRLSHGQRIRRLLEGITIPSRTGKKHRGRGLPSMREDCNRGRINNLMIISNNALARVASDDYTELAHNFPGTIVYWEVASSSNSEGTGDDTEHRT